MSGDALSEEHLDLLLEGIDFCVNAFRSRRQKMSGDALSEEHLDLLLEKVYTAKGWDFRQYRRSSIKRCVERQIALSRQKDRLPSQDVPIIHTWIY